MLTPSDLLSGWLGCQVLIVQRWQSALRPASWEGVGSPSTSSLQTGSDLGFFHHFKLFGKATPSQAPVWKGKGNFLLSLLRARHCAKRVL